MTLIRTRQHAPALRILIGCLAILPIPTAGGGTTLRQGQVFTEDDAKAKLVEMAAKIPDAIAWKRHANAIRENILRGAKLERLPNPCSLNPIRHSRREMDGYSVENVAFEALPGFFITGNLYLPLESDAPIPGVLAPHGHRENKRRVEETQYRSASMARMGAAVFAWDMLGYGESEPCKHKHKQSLRLQTFSSLRAVDFLLSLGIVDEDRLAVTGASGGGTQTFLLAAIDPRIDVSAPVVQVSAHFYGGCNCESGMPIHVHGEHETNNVEIAASIAPKPMLLVSNGDDWTVNTPQLEFPYVQRLYRMLGAEGNVQNAHFSEERHDYGPSKRKAVYRFFAKHLGLDLNSVQDTIGAIDESFVTMLQANDLAVFSEDHPRPDYSVKECAEVVRMLDASDK